jgi:hypothetical protein
VQILALTRSDQRARNALIERLEATLAEPTRTFARRVGTAITGTPEHALGGYKDVVSPPSMTKSAPVTFPARLLASTRTTSATSWGWVNRPVTASLAA